MSLLVYGKTDVGRVRSTNQDACDFGDLPENSGIWAVVCDGMGGTNGGNIASDIAVKTISREVQEACRSGMEADDIRDIIECAIDEANAEIYYKSIKELTLSGMGTTVAMAVITDGRAHIAHVGDSRVYVISNNSVIQLTRDHSIVQMMVEAGQISEEEAKNHPQKNVITRAVGVLRYVDIDYCEYDLQEGETLLLCSDGFSNCVEGDEMLEQVLHKPPEELAESLVALANQQGGSDNITVVTVTNKA
ncbi:MAG: Stp1/IreP family PP2C-type Ser/Thr phosphatase [Oscillospiraceae bacterium]|jgi:protein phosphatase|nr:Stp1/IreP family PP2C-type Ser/Thr phosphatase [Oscillospiraceae bacterium]